MFIPKFNFHSTENELNDKNLAIYVERENTLFKEAYDQIYFLKRKHVLQEMNILIYSIIFKVNLILKIVSLGIKIAIDFYFYILISFNLNIYMC